MGPHLREEQVCRLEELSAACHHLKGLQKLRGIAVGAGTCLLVEMASAPLKVLIDSLNRE